MFKSVTQVSLEQNVLNCHQYVLQSSALHNVAQEGSTAFLCSSKLKPPQNVGLLCYVMLCYVMLMCLPEEKQSRVTNFVQNL